MALGSLATRNPSWRPKTSFGDNLEGLVFVLEKKIIESIFSLHCRLLHDRQHPLNFAPPGSKVWPRSDVAEFNLAGIEPVTSSEMSDLRSR